MGSYKVVVKKSAVKEIEKLNKKDTQRVIERIKKLGEDPRPIGSKKLSGQEKYRVRQGNFRILYQIFEDTLIVTVVKVGNRKDVYRS